MSYSSSNLSINNKETLLIDLLEIFGSEDSSIERHLATFYNERCSLSDKIVLTLRKNQYYELVLKKKQKKLKSKNFQNLTNSNDSNTNKKKLSELPNELIELRHGGELLSNTLLIYGELFGICYTNPSLLSNIYYDPHYNVMERLVNLLTNSLLPNHYDRTQEHMMIRILEDVMEYEFKQTNDLTTYLRENTSATKLLAAYLKRSHISDFIESVVKQCGDFCLINPEEDVEVDPEAVYNNLISNLDKTIDIRSSSDPRIQRMCAHRRKKLTQYIKYIMNKITQPSQYPLGLRVICRKLVDLAARRDPNNSKLSESLVGGFIFLRIFNPKIQIYGHECARKPKNRVYAKLIRRRFTLIVKIMQNISNQILGGIKEAWMANLNDLIKSQIQNIKPFFKKLVNVPRLEYFFDMDNRIREKSPEDDLIFVSINDLNFLKKMLVSDYKKKIKNKKIDEKTNKPINNLSDKENALETRFYRLISDINKSDPFNLNKDNNSSNENDIRSHSTYVRINVHQNVTDTKTDISSTIQEKLGFKALQLKVVPILQQLERRKDLLNGLNGSDFKADLITFLNRAQKQEKIYGIDDGIRTVKNTDTLTLKEGLIQCSKYSKQRVELFRRLKRETSDFKKAEKLAVNNMKILQQKMKNKDLEIQKRLQAYNNNKQNSNKKHFGVFNQIFKGINKDENETKQNKITNRNENISSTQSIKSISDESNDKMLQLVDSDIVSTDGIIGNMLASLLNTVGEKMSYNFTVFTARQYKYNSDEFLKLWSNFPENIVTYKSILQRVAKLSQAGVQHELIKSIIESDEEVRHGGRHGKTVENRFKMSVLRKHIIKFSKIEGYNEFILFVQDFIMADMLTACMQLIEPSFLKRKKSNIVGLDQKLVFKCVSKFKIPTNYNNLGNKLNNFWLRKRTRKWGVVISQITPIYSDKIVNELKLHYKNNNKKLSDVAGYFNGSKYIRFDKKTLLSCEAYLEFIIAQLDKYKDKGHILRLIISCMEHCIRSLTWNETIDKVIFKGKINPAFKRIDKLKSDLILSEKHKLRSIYIIRGPSDNKHFETTMKPWLEELIHFRFSKKKETPSMLADILHFLRGGGSTYDDMSITNMSDNGVEKLEQAYGRILSQLSYDAIQIIAGKIFRTKRIYKSTDIKDAIVIHLLGSCMIQIAIHHLEYVMKNLLKQFIQDSKNSCVERVYIAVYALNFICVPECLFKDYLKRTFNYYGSDTKIDQEIENEKKKLGPVINSLFIYLCKAIPLEKHLLSLGDSIQMFNRRNVNLEDEKNMFNDYINKMLLLDWSNEPLDNYLKPIKDIDSEFLIYCLRLAPHIYCDELWQPKASNCSINGKFIGKWLLHKDVKIRDQTLRTIIRAMKDPLKRDDIMKCFIEMLTHNDYQNPPCLSMLLKTITYLMDVYRKEVIISEEKKKRHTQQRVGNINKKFSSNFNKIQNFYSNSNNSNTSNDKNNSDKLRTSNDLPEWFSWQNKADGYGLVLLCHHHSHVRFFAYQFLTKVTELYREFTGHGGGTIYINNKLQQEIKQSLNTRNSSKNISTIDDNKEGESSDEIISDDLYLSRTVGGLIQVYGKSISRLALMAVHKESNDDDRIGNIIGDNNTNSRLSSKSIGSSLLKSQSTRTSIGSTGGGLSHIFSVQRKGQEMGFHTSIRMDALISNMISQLAKHIIDSGLHETILCASDFIYHILGNMPPASANGKSGWSTNEEWKANSPKLYHWINLHTLLFAMVGEGVTNPFTVGNNINSNNLKNNINNNYNIRRPLPGQRGNGGPSFEHTKKQFDKYLQKYFWYCLFEDASWVKDSVHKIITSMHWESIPSVVTSLIHTYKNTQARRKRRFIIADVVFLLSKLTDIATFPVALYHGGKSLVKSMFEFLAEMKNQAFRSDRLEKKRWWDTQALISECYALFLRGLSKIGAHPILKHEFWSFPNTHKSIIEFRKQWKYNKQGISAKRITRDKMPHINQTHEDERFRMFLWLLKFYNDAEKNVIIPFDENDYTATKHRKSKVRHAVFQALQYLLNMGPVIPEKKLYGNEDTKSSHLLKSTNNFLINLLRGGKNVLDELQSLGYKKTSVLDMLCQAESSNVEVLTPLLTFQFEHLLSFYIEKSLEDNKTAKYFFRAIVNVLQTNSSNDRLTIVQSRYQSSDWKIQRPIGEGFLTLVFFYAHRLLFLGLIMIIEPEADPRFSGFLLLKSLAEILVGDDLVKKIENYKFAFESNMSLWVRKNGRNISRLFSKHYPNIASELFRFAIRNAESSEKREWICTFLKPWARVLKLKCMNKTNLDNKIIIPKYENNNNNNSINSNIINTNEKLQKQQLRKTDSLNGLNLSSHSGNYNNNMSQILERSVTGEVSVEVNIPDKIITSKSVQINSKKRSSKKFDNRALPRVPNIISNHNRNNSRLGRGHHSRNSSRLRRDDEGSIQLSNHQTVNLLLSLFNLTVGSEDEFQTSLLKIWNEFSITNQFSNLVAILDALIEEVEKQAAFSNYQSHILPASKNIIFSLYETSDNREIITLYIVRILLRVLTVGASQYSKVNLKIRHRSAEILTRLEERMNEEKDDNDEFFGFRKNNMRLDYGFEAHINNASDDNEKKQKEIQIKRETSASISSNSNIQVITKEEKRASIAASLLVEIIGVDSKPVVPYYPVLVLYASLYISEPMNRINLHHLLVRLMSTLAMPSTFNRLQNQKTSSDDKPSLAAALKASTLELNWEDDDTKNTSSSNSTNNNTNNNMNDNLNVMTFKVQQKKQYMTNHGKYVVLDGASFIEQYCSELARFLKAEHRIGYESLRWAVLSTNQWIAQRAFRIYRQLLNPLNYATVKVVLLTLVGAIDQWDQTSKYTVVKNLQTIPKEFVECMRILDTLVKMATQLKQDEELNDFPALLWAGIALTRANALRENECILFERGLYLVSKFIEPNNKIYYINFKDKKNSNLTDQNTQLRNTDSMGLSRNRSELMNVNEYMTLDNDSDELDDDDSMYVHDDEGAYAPLAPNLNEVLGVESHRMIITTDSGNNNNNNNSNNTKTTNENTSNKTTPTYDEDILNDAFWAYCEEWTPKFEGIQPYLLQGLLKSQYEYLCIKLLGECMITKIDTLVDRSSLRPLLCIISCVPYISYISMNNSDKYLVLGPYIFNSLSKVCMHFSKKLSEYFSQCKNVNFKLNKDDIDIFLQKVSHLCVDIFFKKYAKVVSNYFYGILNSSDCQKYHYIIFKMTKFFLEKDNDYLLCFENIIGKAHKYVLIKNNDINNDMLTSNSATELVKEAITYVKKLNQQNNKNYVANYIEKSSTNNSLTSDPNKYNLTKPTNNNSINFNDFGDLIDISPFPEANLKQVSRALWQIMRQCPVKIRKRKHKKSGKYDKYDNYKKSTSKY